MLKLQWMTLMVGWNVAAGFVERRGKLAFWAGCETSFVRLWWWKLPAVTWKQWKATVPSLVIAISVLSR